MCPRSLLAEPGTHHRSQDVGGEVHHLKGHECLWREHREYGPTAEGPQTRLATSLQRKTRPQLIFPIVPSCATFGASFGDSCALCAMLCNFLGSPFPCGGLCLPQRKPRKEPLQGSLARILYHSGLRSGLSGLGGVRPGGAFGAGGFFGATRPCLGSPRGPARQYESPAWLACFEDDTFCRSAPPAEPQSIPEKGEIR